MALSDDQIVKIWSREPRYHAAPIGSTDIAFARAIEAEVRKQLERPAPCQHQCEAQAFRIDKRSDTRLILQLVEALEKADKISGYPNNRKTITAGRARLVEGGQ